MAIQNRNITLPGIWAENAQTTIPTPPVAGVTYRDTTLNSTAIDKAWPFKTIVDSSDFNQHAFLQDTLIKEAEQYGVMRWNNTTSYKEGGFCLGQDKKLYQAKRDNKGKEPTASTDDWQIPFAIDADVVHKTGDETISGAKTFSNKLNINTSGIAVEIRASDGTRAGSLNALSSNLNSKEVSLYCFDASGTQNAYLAMYYNNGSPLATFSSNYTLSDGDNSNKIPTTKWVNNNTSFAPSNKYVNLELKASGSEYEALDDGYIQLIKSATGGNQYLTADDLDLPDSGTDTRNIAFKWSYGGGYNDGIFFQVRKGQKYKISYTFGGKTVSFKFIYAERSKNNAVG